MGAELGYFLYFWAMARRDFYHEAVRAALINEGWTITEDPYDISTEDVDLLVDLAAERVLAAERGSEKIAVEIKSFLSQSPVSEFHKALGQYENYRLALEERKEVRQLWLAIPLEAWETFFQRPFIQKVLKHHQIECVVFAPKTQTIQQWIK
jgi:hypothetical protein